MNKTILAAILAAVPAIAFAGVQSAFNQIGIYGQAVTTPSSVSASDPYVSVNANGGNTVGGIGAEASGTNADLWYTHLGFNYGFGSAINGGSISGSTANQSASISGPVHGVHGHSLQFNVRFGKLFALAPDLAVGPYLAYQYAAFSVGLNGIGTANYHNNAIGGGIEAGAYLGNGLSFTGHLGYLAGVSSSASAGDLGSANNPPASGDLQIGVRGSYAFAQSWGLFAGINYDRYHATYSYAPDSITAAATVNEVRGLVGVDYHFGQKTARKGEWCNLPPAPVNPIRGYSRRTPSRSICSVAC